MAATTAEVAKSGHLGVLQLLLRYGGDINAATLEDAGGETVLQVAGGSGKLAVVELLLAHGANVNGAGPCVGKFTGLTALQAAAQYGAVDVVEMLLAHGAFIDDMVHRQMRQRRVVQAKRHYRPLQRKETCQWCDSCSAREPTQTCPVDLIRTNGQRYIGLHPAVITM